MCVVDVYVICISWCFMLGYKVSLWVMLVMVWCGLVGWGWDEVVVLFWCYSLNIMIFVFIGKDCSYVVLLCLMLIL